MDLISSVMNVQAAETLARIQQAVAVKVLRVAQDQGQVAVDLVQAAAETVEAAVSDLNEDLGRHLDAYA